MKRKNKVWRNNFLNYGTNLNLFFMNLDPNSQDNFYTQWVKNKMREEEEQRQKRKALESENSATEIDDPLPEWQQRPNFGNPENKEAAQQKQEKKELESAGNATGSNEPVVPEKSVPRAVLQDIADDLATLERQKLRADKKVAEPVVEQPLKEEPPVPKTANTLPLAPEPLPVTEPDDEETFISDEPETYSVSDADFEDVADETPFRSNGVGNNGGSNNGGGNNYGGGGNNRGNGGNWDDGKGSSGSHMELTQEDIDELMRFRANYEVRQKWKVFSIGLLGTAISFSGALIGFVRAYNRFFRRKGIDPDFYPMRPITRYAMKWGAILMWLVLISVAVIVWILFEILGYRAGAALGVIMSYLIANAISCLFIYGIFKAWQHGVRRTLVESDKFGSARFANPDELYPFMKREGFYIGDGMYFKDKGHILTVAGTRGGKGRDIIIPNLLGAANIGCSWVVIDPKCENAAITSDWQRESGQDVVILNPWNLLSEHVGDAQSYNPLDMLSDRSSPNLVDDVAMISEMIVPLTQGDKNAFFSDGARMVIAGLLLHLVTSEPKETRTLKTLWEWTRKIGDDWNELIQAMVVNSDPVNGDTVSNAANEITKLSDSGSETFGSILSNVLQATDFLKSTAMQQSLESGFDPQILVEGRTTVYVVIPADKLRSHARWLRLVVTSMMRAVIRKPKNRVCFLLDEFAALGYLPEIETALSTYSGYNVTVWPILQSLIQLKNLYRDNWESFIANSAVRQYFSIKDNFSADYISKAAGDASNVLVSHSWFGVNSAESNKRPLLTPDEIRIRSGHEIFLFINELPVTTVQKVAYFIMEVIKDRAKKNPYFN